MYYPEEVIQQVIEANDIVDVIGQYVSLKKSGANYMGLCPFHNEKTPSFSVSQSKQFFHCFGCGAGGNVITFLMKYENYTFQEALKVLADRAGIKLPEAHYSEQARQKARQRDALLAINKAAATYYFHLLRSPKGKVGMDYFVKRQLSPETMNRFGLGFADGARSDMVAYLRSKGYRDEDILASGIGAFDEKRGLHDKFWNRVMFPIMDVTNRVIGFGGRVMGDGKPKYLNSPETPVFDKSRNLYGLNLAKKSKAPYFILCEGYMDTIAMHQAGFDMAVASLGTAFTQQQAQILKRYGKQVLLDYDSDGAGVKAAMRNIGILRSVGIQPKVINMRPAKDADEFMKTIGREEFQKRIDEAENSFFYEIRMIEGNYHMDDPASRTDFYHEIARRLCGFEDEIERDNYIKAMADKYFIPVDSLRREVAAYQEIGADRPDSLPGGRRERNMPKTPRQQAEDNAAVIARGIAEPQSRSVGNSVSAAEAVSGPAAAGYGVTDGLSSGSEMEDYSEDLPEDMEYPDLNPEAWEQMAQSPAGGSAAAGSVHMAPDGGEIASGRNSKSTGPDLRRGSIAGGQSDSARQMAGMQGTGGQNMGVQIPGAVVQRPEGPRRLSLREQGNRRNERLLLTWLSDEPALYLQIRNYITPADFDEGVYRQAAEKYFGMLAKHFGDELNITSGITPDGQPSDSLSAKSSVSPAAVIAIFDDPEDQNEAALMFSTRIEGIDGQSEKEKAFKDVVLAIKQASVDRAGMTPGPDSLRNIVEGKKVLQQIQAAQFHME